ncbi:hypothetical protein TSOC_000540 [Tetrabaena socialis]|uniref:LamG-like jellyroll fold domain-containing protein n=1 Tax=Tetrabaena socialis TaxID=47790 RepID=A0A2J8AJ24_9CHLO|nr:hypothetical protein TSOC_000540 [Tetrabaena socialis]|eukprot:PNH12517.1 hypothetical protein TSOC_000540 [Tetrabaena socialis]
MATAIESLQNLRSQVAEKGSIAIFVILALVAIAVLVAFLVIKLAYSQTRGVLIVDSPLKLYNMSTQTRVDQSIIPPTVNGQEFSSSFWLYLVDYQPTDGPQLIFMRGSDTTTIGTANPIVALDGTTNKLYVSARTSRSTTTNPATFMTQATSGYLTAIIDYFPLQRWVNVVMVVKDDAMSLYLNSSLYTVVNVSDLVDTTGLVTNVRARPVFTACTGSLTVGAAGVSGVRDPRGYIAQFRFFNYALTQKDIMTIYTSGPSATSILARLGLAGYGLRTPIYRVDA